MQASDLPFKRSKDLLSNTSAVPAAYPDGIAIDPLGAVCSFLWRLFCVWHTWHLTSCSYSSSSLSNLALHMRSCWPPFHRAAR